MGILDDYSMRRSGQLEIYYQLSFPGNCFTNNANIYYDVLDNVFFSECGEPGEANYSSPGGGFSRVFLGSIDLRQIYNSVQLEEGEYYSSIFDHMIRQNDEFERIAKPICDQWAEKNKETILVVQDMLMEGVYDEKFHQYVEKLRINT